jgi:hypothetical protein
MLIYTKDERPYRVLFVTEEGRKVYPTQQRFVLGRNAGLRRPPKLGLAQTIVMAISDFDVNDATLLFISDSICDTTDKVDIFEGEKIAFSNLITALRRDGHMDRENSKQAWRAFFVYQASQRRKIDTGRILIGVEAIAELLPSLPFDVFLDAVRKPDQPGLVRL